MTSKELKTILGELKLSQTDLARLLDVTPRAVSLWMAGTRNVPGPAASYLKLFASLPLGMRQSELAKKTEGFRTMKNGMYSIEFVGQAGRGVGTLVFEDGRIYGADVGGGIYDGEYQYNEDTGLVDIELRVEMAANHESVTGIVQPFDWILKVTTSINPEKNSEQIDVQTNIHSPIKAAYRFLRTLPVAA